MGKRGKQYKPSKEAREKVKQMAAVGIPQDDIAFYLDISKNTLRKHYERELRLGGIEASISVGGNLFRMTKTHPAAAIFWKKTRDRWRTVDEETERPQSININVNLKKSDTRPSELKRQQIKAKNGTDAE